jgi:hypothetical protein
MAPHLAYLFWLSFYKLIVTAGGYYHDPQLCTHTHEKLLRIIWVPKVAVKLKRKDILNFYCILSQKLETNVNNGY